MGSNFPRMKKAVPIFLTILLSCLAALGVAEIAVRALVSQMSGEVVFGYHEILGAIPLPQHRGVKTPPQGPSYSFSHNSLGFRGSREYPAKQGSYRVLFLGDSFTYGVGVNDDQAFPFLTEEILRAKNYSVETINTGNPGAGTDFQLKLMQVHGKKLQADLVVLGFYWNDFYDNVNGEHFRVGEGGELTPKTPHSLTAKKAWVESLPGIRWLLSWSQAANLVKNSIINFLRWLPKAANRLKNRFAPPPAAAKNQPGTPPPVTRRYPGAPQELKYLPENPPGYKELTQLYLSRLITVVKAQGSDILLCYFPDAAQVINYRQTGKLSPYERDFVEVVQSLGEKPYSLTLHLTASVQGNLDLPYWGHWSPASNREAANYLSALIEEKLQKHNRR